MRRYDIPENSLVLWNQYAVHHDPRLWADPEHFNPEANLLRRVQQVGSDAKPESARDQCASGVNSDERNDRGNEPSNPAAIEEGELPKTRASDLELERVEFEVVNAEYVLTFGLGKRACVGEALARQELFLFFVGLLQRFEVVPSSEHPLPSQYAARSNFKVVRDPLPFHVFFRPIDWVLLYE